MANEVKIGDLAFNVTELITETLAGSSIHAPRIATGDSTAGAADTARSVVAYRDQRGGLGIARSRSGAAEDRYHTGNCDTSFYESIRLPQRPERVAAYGNGYQYIHALANFNNEFYVFVSRHGQDRLKWVKWTGSAYVLPFGHNSPAEANHTNKRRRTGLGEYNQALFSGSGGYSETQELRGWAVVDGVNSAERSNGNTPALTYFKEWSGIFYGMDDLGWLYNYTPATTTAIGTWARLSSARLPSAPTGMYVALGANGVSALYVSCAEGLFVFNSTDSVFVPTHLPAGKFADFGRGGIEWMGDLYLPGQGLEIYRFQPGPTAITSTIGPDRDDGQPFNARIRWLFGSHNRLYAFTEETVSNGIRCRIFEGTQGGAWDILWDSDSESDITTAFSAAAIGTAGSRFGLLWGHSNRSDMLFLPLRQKAFNPNDDPDGQYKTNYTFKHVFSQFDLDDLSLLKTGLGIILEADAPAGTSVVVKADKWRGGSKSAVRGRGQGTDIVGEMAGESGRREFLFSEFGEIFDRMQITLEMRTTDTNLTPEVHRTELAFRRKYPVRKRYSFSVPLDNLPESSYRTLDGYYRGAGLHTFKTQSIDTCVEVVDLYRVTSESRGVIVHVDVQEA